MSGDKEFPTDYRDKLVTLEEPIAAINRIGSQWVDRFRCVEYSEGDEYYQFMQPNISSARDNDVLIVKKDNVRAILIMDDTGEEE